MPSPVGIFKIRLAASAFWNCSDKRTIPLSSSTLRVLFVNGELRVADDVEEENVRDLKLDLFFTSAGISVLKWGLASGMVSTQLSIVESKGSKGSELGVERWAFSSEIGRTHGATSRVSRQSDSRGEWIQNPARPGRIDCRRSCRGCEGTGQRSCR